MWSPTWNLLNSMNPMKACSRRKTRILLCYTWKIATGGKIRFHPPNVIGVMNSCYSYLYPFFHHRLTWSFLWSVFWLIQISVCVSRVFIATRFPHQVILGVIGGKYALLCSVMLRHCFVCLIVASDSPGHQFSGFRGSRIKPLTHSTMGASVI